ncbi:DUF3857 domain-containing protein [Ekhidna sp.]|uniref:DUF3857 domain-containing protein n=1 Tax=Ekhidna sp. TaxID=2608089 RepID=UPI003299AA31
MKNLLYIVLILCIQEATGQAREFARINKETLTVDIKGQERLQVTNEYSITIYNEAGYSSAHFIDYEDQFRKLSSFVMIIRDKAGKKIKSIGSGKIMRFSLSQSFETGDANYVAVDPEYKNFPFTVEVTAVFDQKGFLNLPTWIPRDRFNVSVDASTLKVVIPFDYRLRFKEENLKSHNVESINKGKSNLHSWTVKDLSAVERDVTYKSFIEDQPKVYLAPSSFVLDGYVGKMISWEGFGDWFLELNQNRNTLLPGTMKMLDDLPNDDVETTVATLYKYMQDRTRYVSIQLGIGGFQSLPAKFVDERGYGECKALTNYMKAMLHYKGIKSNYILAKAGQDASNIKNEFPSNQFNHVFLGVVDNQDTIFLECTSQTIPPNYIGTFTDDRHVLWVDSARSQIIRTPVYDENENVLKKNANLNLDENGNANLDLDVNYNGIFFDKSSLFNTYTSEQLDDYNLSQFDYRDFTITNFEVDQNVNLAELNCKYTLEIQNLAKKVADRLILVPAMLQPMDFYIHPNEFTRYLEIRRGFTLDETIIVDLPENFRVDVKPESEAISTQFGNYEINISYELNKIRILRKVIIKKGSYEADTFDAFLDFKKKIEKLDNQKIVLGKKT